MKISILCSDPAHPVNAHLERWVRANAATHHIRLLRRKSELESGDLLFLVSCAELVGARERSRFGKTLVLHASALPEGRGWSPHVWQILRGADALTVTLLEAADKVDSGRIWSQMSFPVDRGALWAEINDALFTAEMELMDFAVREFDRIVPREQDASVMATYYDRRTAEDSRVDPSKSLGEQFDLIRVCDPGRFPAFMDFRGRRYKIILEDIDG
jgi:methionyl-tRNA formyltransferase